MTSPVTVSISIKQITGTALPRARVTFERTAADIDGAIIAPAATTVTCDDDGLGTASLLPNATGSQGTQTRVTVVNEHGELQFSGLATIPASSCDLHDVLNLAPPGVVDDAQAAATAAQGYASVASTQAGIATAKATEATAVLSDPGFVAVAAITAEIDAVAAIAADVTTVAANGTNIDTVAVISGSVTTVAGAAASVVAVAEDVANIDAVAADLANIDAVAADLVNLDAVAADLPNVDTVAINIAAVNDASTNMAAIIAAPTHAAAAEANATAAAEAVHADLQAALTAQATSLINTQAIVVAHHAFA